MTQATQASETGGAETVRDFRSLLRVLSERKAAGSHFRLLERVPAGDWMLSVQASEHHYCTPRETVAVGEYMAWEVAVFTTGGDEWVTPETNPALFEGNGEASRRWEPGDGASVGGYIPTAAVQALYERALVLSAASRPLTPEAPR